MLMTVWKSLEGILRTKGRDQGVIKRSSLRKSKLSEPHTRAQRFCKNSSATTKNKPYFVRPVGKLVE